MALAALFLFDPALKSAAELQEMVNAARARGVEVSTHGVAKAEEIVPAIDAAQVAGAAALNVLATCCSTANRQLILERTTALRMPAIYQFPESAEQGGFAGLGPRLEHIYRQVAVQIPRLLRGERPTGLAGPAGDDVRASDQSHDREGGWGQNLRQSALPRR